MTVNGLKPSVTRRNTDPSTAAAWLTGTMFLALALLYFVGLDQGATSILGSDTHIHEFIHDARHLLGYACH